MLFFVAFVVSFVGVSHGFLDDDPCYMMTVSDLSKDSQVLNLPIAAGCAEGQVDWHYPKGDLMLEAILPKADSVLCIEESWATMIGEVREVTDGINKPMPMPVKDSPSCSSQASTHLKVLLSAEDTQYYMTTFKYRIQKVQ